MADEQKKSKLVKLTTLLTLVVLGMFGFSFALIPLYDVFCEVTGINGKSTALTSQSSAKESLVVDERLVKVEFLAISNGTLPWEFRPMVRSVEVHPGETNEIAYFAKNLSDHPITAQAVPSVSPGVAASHFNKIECFCFTQQTLQPGEEKEMPVQFMVSPELAEGVRNIVLSYTFFQQGDVEHEHLHEGKKMQKNNELH